MATYGKCFTRKKFRIIMKAKINLKNIKSYIVGNYRYKLYYSSYFYILIKKYIREQIEMRIECMDEECFLNGSCKLCGCETTALQMANKACDKPCYPAMMDKKSWERFKTGALYYDKETKMMWWYKKGELLNYKSKKNVGK